MRTLICDDHLVFGESLAAVLASRDHDIVAVTSHPTRALSVLRGTGVDLCLLDVTFDSETVFGYLAAMLDAAPDARMVLLSGRVDQTLVAAADAAGVHAVADKRQPISEIISIVGRVMSGEVVLPRHVPHRARTADPRSAPAADAHRLASYLTPRERQVLGALVRGEDTARLARNMHITLATARCHIQNVLTKMGAHSRLEAVTTAARYRLVSQETGEWLA